MVPRAGSSASPVFPRRVSTLRTKGERRCYAHRRGDGGGFNLALNA